MNEEVIIIGAGPCGLAAAIALKEMGIQPLIIEKGNVVDSIFRYPTHQTFFSSSEKLEIGDTAFITENRKAVRNQALAYYREVAKRKELRIHKFEKVEKVEKQDNGRFFVKTSKGVYTALHVIVSTGYYDHPNYMSIPGEQLPKVFHYFKEGHPYFNCDVTVIGGKNSSVDAALELVKAGARVTVLYRGSEYSTSIKPWILPEFESLVRNGTIVMERVLFIM
jgi:thioredoxin reductase (NADPH)